MSRHVLNKSSKKKSWFKRFLIWISLYLIAVRVSQPLTECPPGRRRPREVCDQPGLGGHTSHVSPTGYQGKENILCFNICRASYSDGNAGDLLFHKIKWVHSNLGISITNEFDCKKFPERCKPEKKVYEPHGDQWRWHSSSTTYGPVGSVGTATPTPPHHSPTLTHPTLNFPWLSPANSHIKTNTNWAAKISGSMIFGGVWWREPDKMVQLQWRWRGQVRRYHHLLESVESLSSELWNLTKCSRRTCRFHFKSSPGLLCVLVVLLK